MKKLIVKVKEEGKEGFWRQISAVRLPPPPVPTPTKKKGGGNPYDQPQRNQSFLSSVLLGDRFLYVVLAILDPAV